MKSRVMYLIFLAVSLSVGGILINWVSEKTETNVKEDIPVVVDREYILKQEILELDLPEEQNTEETLIPMDDKGCTPEMLHDGDVSVDCLEAIEVFQCGEPMTVEEYAAKWLTEDGDWDYELAEKEGVNIHRLDYPIFNKNLEPLVLSYFCKEDIIIQSDTPVQAEIAPKWSASLQQEAKEAQYLLIGLYQKINQYTDRDAIQPMLEGYFETVDEDLVNYFDSIRQTMTDIVVFSKNMTYISHSDTRLTYTVEVQVSYTEGSERKQHDVVSTISVNRVNGKIASYYPWLKE